METKRQEIITQCDNQKSKLDETKPLNILIDEAYKIFKKYIDDDTLIFKNKKIFFNIKMNKYSFREQGFEHIITKDFGKTSIPLYDKNRVIHLPIIEKIIKQCCNNKCSELKVFKDKKDICIWCKRIDFLIILSERNNGYLLKTAYPVVYTHKRQSLKRKANENDLLL